MKKTTINRMIKQVCLWTTLIGIGCVACLMVLQIWDLIDEELRDRLLSTTGVVMAAVLLGGVIVSIFSAMDMVVRYQPPEEDDQMTDVRACLKEIQDQ